jgi:hypothetical protein
MASTNVVTPKEYSNGLKVLTVSMTCASDSPDFSDVVLEERSKRLVQATIVPGATGPTDDSDLSLTDSITGVNLVATSGANAVDNATTNVIAPDNTSNIVVGGLTLSIANNAVNNASVTIYLVFTSRYLG